MKFFHWILAFADLLVVLAASGHALINKRDPRAALGWISVCLIFPFVGPFLYFLFGINRVRTRAKKLEQRSPFRFRNEYLQPDRETKGEGAGVLIPPEYAELARVSGTVTRRPLLGGNRVEVLHNGEEAYPAMLEAIETAEISLFLATYIFETNRTGLRFIDALSRAVERGVDVRVILDGIGELHSLPRAGTLLRKKGVRSVRFIPPGLIPPSLHINLRNHRKILVADGRTAFVGGMNIGDRHLAGVIENPGRVVDVHFRLKGPVVGQIEETFLEDWGFVTGEHGVSLRTPSEAAGEALCRVIVEGPNEDIDKLASILMGAASAARRSLSIMSPYFLPSRELSGALQAAALRGVDVSVLLPSRNNLPFVHWATKNMLWELLQRGIRVYYQPPPFVHSKLFVVDDHYAHIGSANIDPRSLRLNFELAVEVYDRSFVGLLNSHIRECMGRSREVTLEEVDGRPLAERTRDALAWLFTPYL